MSFLAFRGNRSHSHLLKSMIIECCDYFNPIYSFNRYLNSSPYARYCGRVNK